MAKGILANIPRVNNDVGFITWQASLVLIFETHAPLREEACVALGEVIV